MASFRRNNIVPYMEGCLEKRIRPKFCNWWRKYWFILNGKTLLCFRNREESEVYSQYCRELLRNIPRKEFLNFTKVHAVRPIHSSSNKFSFEVVTRKSTVILATINEEMRKKWIEAFQNALQLSIISSPIKEMPCANPDNKHLFFGNKEYSLSQPNLSNRMRDGENASVRRHHSFQRRRATVTRSHYQTEFNNQENREEDFGGSMELTAWIPNRRLTNNRNQLTTSSAVLDRNSAYRCTAVDFFMSEQNVNWPSLSMDIQDEIFQEVIHQHEEMKRMLIVGREHDNLVAEMSTQTEFSDESSSVCESDGLDEEHRDCDRIEEEKFKCDEDC